MQSRFKPGQRVTIANGEIEGVIERVIFARDRFCPLYFVEWWSNGDLMGRELCEDDICEVNHYGT